jgi:hypothetical protein
MKTMYSGVLVGWRKTNNKKLQNMYTAVHSIIIFIKSRMIRWGAHAGLIHWERHTKFLFENQNIRQLGRLGHRWEDSFKMDLKIIRIECVDCIHLSQQRRQWWSSVQTVINIHVLWKAKNLTGWALNNLHMDTTARRGGRTELKEAMTGTGQRLRIWWERNNCQNIFASSTTAVQKSTIQ